MATTWAAIRAFYRRHAADIQAAGPTRWGCDPYGWSFEAHISLTPIEAAVWHDIRAERAVLYPQIPVAGRFVDFGNPCARVALECDGLQWHQDIDRDARRQRQIEAAGWTVYRITGSDCVKPDSYELDDLGVERLVPGPARTLIRRICDAHGVRHA